MSIHFDLGQLDRLRRKLTQTPRILEEMKEQLLEQYGNRLLSTVIRNASGRPGPNIQTGQYVGNMVLIREPDTRRVANYSPQTHRLEYGFVGTDTLGRNYTQPAFPHFRPALMEVKEEFKAEFRKLPKKAWAAA